MPVEYPTLATAAGTEIHISTTAPASHDVAGFDGVLEASWLRVGAVVNSGGFPKSTRDFETVNLLDGTSLVIPQNEQMEALEIETVYQPSDAGQNAVEAASNGTTIRWMRWTLPNGHKTYAAGYITGYGPSAESSEDYVASTFTFQPIFDVNKVGVVRSKADIEP